MKLAVRIFLFTSISILLDELLAVSVIILGALAIIIALRYAYIIMTEDDKKEDKKNKKE